MNYESSLWYWYLDTKRKICFIEESDFAFKYKFDFNLGECHQCSREECIRLLRKNKIPRSLINEITIDDSVNELIPF